MREQLSCLSLLKRIDRQTRRDAWRMVIKYVTSAYSKLFIYFILLLVFQCHNLLYNSWNGPFSKNREEFRNHLETNYNLFGYEYLLSFRWLFFEHEYIQIELGEDTIDQNPENSLKMFYANKIDGRLSHRLNRILEPAVNNSNMTVFIKTAVYKLFYFPFCYSYCFESFNINTLQCIAKQLDILPAEFLRWHEKSMYVEKIKLIYNQNPKVFNDKLILKCGILVGYLQKPKYNSIFHASGNEYYQFNDDFRVLDASCSYTPYKSYLLISIFIYLLFITVIKTIQCVIIIVRQPPLILHPSFEQQVKQSDIMSIENLDNFLLNTTYENSHHDRLFIVCDKYLVMIMTSLSETSDQALRNFCENSPLILIAINSIIILKPRGMILEINNKSQYIDFPTGINSNYYNPIDWLHERLMLLSNPYKNRYIQIFSCVEL